MTKPTYLPLLNSIAVNEAKGEKLLQTWADATRDAKLKAALEFVAIREGEHAMAFTKRMCELGHAVDEDSAYQVFKDFDGLLACAASDISDADKVAMLSGGERDDKRDSGKKQRDPFVGFFNDTSIDPETGALLGRYIAEERDSGRRLQAEYDRVCAGSRSDDDQVAALCETVAALQADVAKLSRKLKKKNKAA
ncbi:MAG: hypothetical protein RJQ07_02740 [Pseudomonadales bacterium]